MKMSQRGAFAKLFLKECPLAPLSFQCPCGLTMVLKGVLECGVLLFCLNCMANASRYCNGNMKYDKFTVLWLVMN